MTTEEKLKLLSDVRTAIHALGRILDGGHHETERTEPLYTDCMGALASLTMLELGIVAEVGTDNIDG
jgi:hypothetical protein